MSKKQPRQKKSRTYYYFWSVMSATVLLGQLYVGTGYRIMSQSTNELTDLIYDALNTPASSSFNMYSNDQ